jgi:hypothetical protein
MHAGGCPAVELPAKARFGTSNSSRARLLYFLKGGNEKGDYQKLQTVLDKIPSAVLEVYHVPQSRVGTSNPKPHLES